MFEQIVDIAIYGISDNLENPFLESGVISGVRDSRNRWHRFWPPGGLWLWGLESYLRCRLMGRLSGHINHFQLTTFCTCFGDNFFQFFRDCVLNPSFPTLATNDCRHVPDYNQYCFSVHCERGSARVLSPPHMGQP